MSNISENQAKTLVEHVLSVGSPLTRSAYTKDLEDFRLFTRKPSIVRAAAHLLEGDFDAADKLVKRYRDTMAAQNGRDLSSATVNRRLTVLRSLAKASHRRGWTTWVLDVKSVKHESVKVPDGPPAEKAAAMLVKATETDSPADRRTFAILRLALDLGLRRAGICALDVGDVDLKALKIRVRLKGGVKKRTKDLAVQTAQAIELWLDIHPARPAPKNAPLFVNLIEGRHTRLSGPAVYNIVRAVSSSVGCRTRPHGLRHTAITEAVKRAGELGETLDQVRAFSDHKDFRMVLRYRDAAAGVQKKFTGANAAAFGDPLAKRRRSG